MPNPKTRKAMELEKKSDDALFKMGAELGLLPEVGFDDPVGEITDDPMLGEGTLPRARSDAAGVRAAKPTAGGLN